MRKIILATAALTLLPLALLLVSCNNKVTDSYKNYRQLTAQELFKQGEASLNKKNYATAAKELEAMEALYPFGPYAEQGAVDIIYAYYKNGDDDLALAAADRYIRLYPRGAHVDYAYYMKGVVSDGRGLTWLQRKVGSDPAPRDLANKKQAFASLNQMAVMFPKSPYLSDATKRMNDTRNLIARHYVLVAEFYLKKKVYVAAANRASYVVKHFSGSPEVIPALTIMIKAYRRLGLTERADSALRIFEANYPNSRELKKLKK